MRGTPAQHSRRPVGSHGRVATHALLVRYMTELKKGQGRCMIDAIHAIIRFWAWIKYQRQLIRVEIAMGG